MRFAVFKRASAHSHCHGAQIPIPDRSCAAAVILLLSLAVSHGAQAQVTFSLTPADEIYAASASAQTVDYYGTISNLGNTTIYLNAIDIEVEPAFSSSVTPNESLFYDNVPVTLSAFGTEGSSYSGVVFGIDLGATNVTAPSYSGEVSIQGGATDSSQDTLGTMQEFLGMPQSSSAMPEPSSVCLAASAILGAICFAGSRRFVRSR